MRMVAALDRLEYVIDPVPEVLRTVRPATTWRRRDVDALVAGEHDRRRNAVDRLYVITFKCYVLNMHGVSPFV